jgi:hypothetical protein
MTETVWTNALNKPSVKATTGYVQATPGCSSFASLVIGRLVDSRRLSGRSEGESPILLPPYIAGGSGVPHLSHQEAYEMEDLLLIDEQSHIIAAEDSARR